MGLLAGRGEQILGNQNFGGVVTSRKGEQILGNQNFRGGVTGRKGGTNTR